MKIYTKTGDYGETSLYGGKRVKKNHARINAYGTTDELLAHIGLIRDQKINPIYQDDLVEIQDRLFTIGAELAADPEKTKLKRPNLYQSDIHFLEEQIDKMEQDLVPMKSFVLPGGHQTVSFCHIARCVCRRAERTVIDLSEETEVSGLIIIYLNRLSDYLFVLSRKFYAELKAIETPWKPRKENNS